MLRKLLFGAAILLAILVITEVVALLVMKSSVARYAEYWRERAAEPSQPGEFVYVALGDSAAQGIGATSAEKGYVGLIAKQVGQATGRPVRVINLSATGAKLRDVLDQQLPQLTKHQPDLVTMEIGANDLLDYDAATFATDYGRILDRLPAGKTVVSDMPYFGGRIDVRGNDATASQVIRRLAAERDIPVAQLYRSLHDRHSLRIYAADYFHPSNYGYTIWYDAFWAEVGPIVRGRS